MQTIGERLEEARKRKSISIREAAEGTKIRGDYLQKFESNQFDIGLTDIYVRGFLRSYAVFLGLPAERIVNDYASLGHAEPRPRTPSREVYGRMDLSVSSGGADRGSSEGPATESASAVAAADGAGHQRVSLRPHASGLPAPTRINPAVAFKGLVIGGGIALILVLFFLAKAFFGGTTHHAAEPGASASPPATASVPAATAVPAEPDVINLIAIAPVSVRVFRKSDNVELFRGQMARDERKEFANVGLIVTASAIEALQFDFKGSHYKIDAKGRGKFEIPVQQK